MGPLLGALNTRGLDIDECPISPEELASLIQFVEDGVISHTNGKKALEIMMDSGQPAWQVIFKNNMLQQSDDDELEKIIGQVIKENPQTVEEIKGGKKKAIGFLVGQVIRC